MLRLLNRRTLATAAGTNAREGWLYVNSVFPVQLGSWDLRYYIGIFRQERLLNDLQTRLEQLSAVNDFKPLQLDPHHKDGGVFVLFSYTTLPDSLNEGADPLTAFQNALNEEADKHGGISTWTGIKQGQMWVVRGSPWKEDMNRFASPILKLSFEGPDIPEQALYELCRPYGRIRELSYPTPTPAGSLRSSIITYQNISAATTARNVLHGLRVTSSSDPTLAKTRLRAHYEKPLEAHVVRDWMSSHPKIMLPIIVFLLGTLTYTIFDPIRALMVEAKMLDRFDYKKSKFYLWLQDNALYHFGNNLSTNSRPLNDSHSPEVWKERRAAESALHAYLADTPTTIAFVHGPQGSGKTTMLNTVIRESGRHALVIDCRELLNTATDSALVGGLAAQTGYWPIFTFLNSMNSLIDIASVGLIGQKAGLSNSLPEQLKQILEVVTHALNGVSSSRRSTIENQIKRKEESERRRIQISRRKQAIMEGTWHDGRLDCVAGNGIMSELGVGDELFDAGVAENLKGYEESMDDHREEQSHINRRQNTISEVEAVNTLPVVIIRNYAANFGASSKEDLLVVLAQWAASLVENHVAHVIVLSDNRENSKRLTKALPTKPLNSIALSDADSSSALSFVKQKLHDSGTEVSISGAETKYIERLGGRASDLESLIHKVRNGMKVEEAVEDIINKGVAELQKNAFGEDSEDGKNLPWTRYQAWKVLKMLSGAPEVGYYDMLVDFPFKGDENALRSMEHAELISVSNKNGRPATIRPGKPVLRWVFERIANDKYFRATQELAYNEKQILDTEAKIAKYEEELSLLVNTMEKEPRPWYSFRKSPCRDRARSVGEKLAIAERKVALLERKNAEHKRTLAKEV